MGYLHIENYYRSQLISLFKQCYALEKIHGTSAHLHWNGEKITYFAGGEKYANFIQLFDDVALTEKFENTPNTDVTVYGEAYGGKCQGQSWRYGKELKFVAFDVKIDDNWLNVPSAERFVNNLGLEFVYYKQIPTDIESLDAERDAPSEQAKRNGMGDDKPREGVVCRPLMEMRTSAKNRVIVKHKRAEERETKTQRVPLSPEKQKVLDDAKAIAEEHVTPVRLEHVLDKLKVDGQEVPVERTGEVIMAMVEDVCREAQGEFVETKGVRKAIGTMASKLFMKRLSLMASGRMDLWGGTIKPAT